jgi:hypothetical protein
MENQSQLQTPQAKTINQKPSEQFGKTYLFKLRQHKTGNFAGLWELSRINSYGKVDKMISDADALTYCLENLQGELEDDGF